LKDRRISELPVVDAAGRPIGMLDITDVIAAVSLVQESGSAAGSRQEPWPGEAVHLPLKQRRA
jgi:arabinose-5-phosphate isomerase